ncbi:MAG: hypothetical protein Kapaf2KO_21910 [Candidatus Kapaibacteriales bacterium]
MRYLFLAIGIFVSCSLVFSQNQGKKVNRSYTFGQNKNDSISYKSFESSLDYFKAKYPSNSNNALNFRPIQYGNGYSFLVVDSLGLKNLSPVSINRFGFIDNLNISSKSFNIIADELSKHKEFNLNKDIEDFYSSGNLTQPDSIFYLIYLRDNKECCTLESEEFSLYQLFDVNTSNYFQTILTDSTTSEQNKFELINDAINSEYDDINLLMHYLIPVLYEDESVYHVFFFYPTDELIAKLPKDYVERIKPIKRF